MPAQKELILDIETFFKREIMFLNTFYSPFKPKDLTRPIFSDGLDKEGWSKAVKKFMEISGIGLVEISAYEWANTSPGMKELDVRIPHPTRRDLICKARIGESEFIAANDWQNPPVDKDVSYTDFKKDGQGMLGLSDMDLLLMEIGFFEPVRASADNDNK